MLVLIKRTNQNLDTCAVLEIDKFFIQVFLVSFRVRKLASVWPFASLFRLKASFLSKYITFFIEIKYATDCFITLVCLFIN